MSTNVPGSHFARMAGFVDLLFVGSRLRRERCDRAENPNVHLPIAFDRGSYEIDSYRRFAFPNEQLYDIAHFRWSATVKQITASAGSPYISNNIINHNLHNQCPSVWIVPIEFFTPAASLCCSLMPVIRVLIKRTRHSNDLWPLVGRIAGVSRPFWIASTQAQLRLAVGE